MEYKTIKQYYIGWRDWLNECPWTYSRIFTYNKLESAKGMKANITQYIKKVKKANGYKFGVIYCMVFDPNHRKHIHSLWVSKDTLDFPKWSHSSDDPHSIKLHNEECRTASCAYFTRNILEGEFGIVQHSRRWKHIGWYNGDFIESMRN